MSSFVRVLAGLAILVMAITVIPIFQTKAAPSGACCYENADCGEGLKCCSPGVGEKKCSDMFPGESGTGYCYQQGDACQKIDD